MITSFIFCIISFIGALISYSRGSLWEMVIFMATSIIFCIIGADSEKNYLKLKNNK